VHTAGDSHAYQAAGSGGSTSELAMASECAALLGLPTKP
jgi:hypothetical protein